MDISTQIKMLNEKYELNDSNGIRCENFPNYTFIPGKVPILLSAPHAVNQVRNNQFKLADRNTGGIVEYLCSKCNCYGIIRNYNNSDDPNSDNIGLGLEYKNRIITAVKENNVKFVLDVHGCSDKHNFDFCFGTNYGKNLNGKKHILDILNIGLSSIGETTTDNLFKASLENNISKYVASNSSATCIQLEISNKYRIDETYIEQLVVVLQSSIDNINKRILSIEKYNIEELGDINI